MKPERLIYTFVSYASFVNKHWGHGVPVEGVDRIAATAHRNGIPVTWIVNSGSIEVLSGKIRSWHELYGDDVILECIPDALSKDKFKVKIQLKEAIEKEWRALEEAFPWVRTKVIGGSRISSNMLKIIEELDVKGIWGYCWEQVWWDGISHRGIPWGSWYIDSERYKVPHTGKGNLVACEWTARDLNSTYHTGNPCIYSTDPDDVYRAGLCSGTDVKYWKYLFEDYLYNTDHNENLFFVQQQEAHEMENTDGFAVWPLSQIEAADTMLDHFFRYIRKYDITLTTLPQAVELYHEKNPVTAPSYMLTRGNPIRPEINGYTMTLGGTGLGPWPETFFYYDQECQLAFVKGECRPRLLRSYIGKWNMEDDFREDIPPVIVTVFIKTESRIEIEFEMGYWNPVPIGLTYWDDLSGFEVEACSPVHEVKILQDKLVFLRFNLTGEKKKIHLVLGRK